MLGRHAQFDPMVMRTPLLPADERTTGVNAQGEYELRILFDENNNGVWDTGNYAKKIQPEKAITLDKNLSIKANWDNERDIKL